MYFICPVNRNDWTFDYNCKYCCQGQKIKDISERVKNVTTITDDNLEAINTIVDKNEDTSGIAGDIRVQSEENKELAIRLDRILKQFAR